MARRTYTRVGPIRLYLKLLFAQLRSEAQHVVDFWIGIFGLLLMQLSGFLFLWTVFRQLDGIAGWTLWEALLLYALLLLPRGLVDFLCNGSWMLAELVNRGGFERILLRPVSPALQVLAQAPRIHGIGHLLLGGYLVVASSQHLHVDWTLGKIAFAILCVGSSVVMLGSILFAANCVAFWEKSGSVTFALLTYNVSDTVAFPISIYSRSLQIFLTWILPFAFMSFVPASVILGKPLAHAWMAYASLPVALATALVARIVWTISLRRYEGTGH